MYEYHLSCVYTERSERNFAHRVNVQFTAPNEVKLCLFNRRNN